MSITAEQAVAAAGSPRELLDDQLFDTLSAYVARRQEVTLTYAERMVEQMLVWLRAVADNPQAPAPHATGYPVDAEFWVGAKPCCPPNPCVVSVSLRA
ncbi:hypothetical protein ACIBI3_01425 [Actinomadura luteofluorescens]|uniref:hypothetical protein n=1 Tax=Actinomadura luteofluorescens TaxID=46163 RepID=UPI00347882E6